MTLESALLLTLIALSFSLCVQGLELWTIERNPAFQTIWKWSVIRSDYRNWPPAVVSVLDFSVGGGFPVLIKVQLFLGVLLPLSFYGHPLILNVHVLSLMACVFLSGLRFRGVFNGGSDFMTMTLLVGLFIATVPTPYPETQRFFGFALIAVQATLSYFIAGVVKLKTPAWRNGSALGVFLQHSNYKTPDRVKTRPFGPSFLWGASWAVLIWEGSFPIVWVLPSLLVPYLTAGILFHLSNFYFFGLNRFLWSWLASYPALFYCIQTLKL